MELHIGYHEEGRKGVCSEAKRPLNSEKRNSSLEDLYSPKTAACSHWTPREIYL